MRSFRHWTPTYIRDRLALFRYERANPDAPWLTRDMNQLLESWLQPVHAGLEFGSGRSTLWLAARVGRLTSVEHDVAWFAKVSSGLAERRLAGIVDYRLCDHGLNSGARTRYEDIGSEFPRDSVDFVLVDGMSRDQCALVSIPALKRSGLLIVDNVNWYIPCSDKSRSPNSRSLADGYASDAWRQFHEEVHDWQSIWTCDGVTDAAAWFKPA